MHFCFFGDGVEDIERSTSSSKVGVVVEQLMTTSCALAMSCYDQRVKGHAVVEAAWCLTAIALVVTSAVGSQL